MPESGPDSPWYRTLDEGVRSIVHTLRNSGFNTTCSCDKRGQEGQKPYVQCSWPIDNQLKRLHDLLYNAGHRNYQIELLLEVIDGQPRCFATISFGGNL